MISVRTFEKRIIFEKYLGGVLFMKKQILALTLAVAMMVSLSACGSEASPGASDSSGTGSNVSDSGTESLSKRVFVSTAQGGSLYYTVGIAVTQLWNEKIPGASASANSSSGSAENLTL